MSELGGPGSRRRTLPPVSSSVSEARRTVSELLTEVEREDLAETAALLVSELVTNAVLHAGTGVELNVTYDGRSLLVEVGDGSPHLPVPRRYATTAGTGRGLMMLEQLVDDWGVRRRDDGKGVWFRLSKGDRVPAARNAVPDTETFLDVEAADTVSVTLLDFPLLLHAAWHEHAESLLRELLLATLDEGTDLDPIQVHAEATDALAILAEHAPVPDVVLEADEPMRYVTEPHVTLPVLRLPVPASSVRSFRTLDRAVRAALELTRNQISLTPPTQPELQSFRQWLCRQVEAQADGGPAEPWTVDGDVPPQPPSHLDWDDFEVRTSEACMVAADATNRILAVSAAAADMLGYDEPGDLVGRRLVTIIPERYQQAHVAGVALMQLTGRSPLLGRTVRVPALRRDRSEVQVDLRVTAHRVAGSAAVFVADMSPATDA